MKDFTIKTVLVRPDYGPEELIQAIMSVSSGVLLLRGTNPYLDALKQNTTCNDRHRIFSNEQSIVIHLCPVCYVDANKPANLIYCRDFAAQNLYHRWCEFLYKRQAKSCYSSKPFMNFMDKIEYMKSDYVVFQVDKN